MGSQINRADWTKERIRAFRRYLGGDQGAEYHGRKKNGEPYKKALKVSTLMEYYKGWTFSFRNGKVYAQGNNMPPRAILTDDQVRAKAVALYRSKEVGLGKAPSIYQFMNRKYINVSYKKVEAAIKGTESYQKYQARHVTKPKARKIIIARDPGAEIDCDLMYFTTDYFAPSRNEGFGGLLVVVDRFSGYIAVEPFKHGKYGHTSSIIAAKTAQILQSGRFPTKKGGTIFHDNGSEFMGIFPEQMRQLGYNNVVVSLAAGAPSPHAERAVGIIRKLINTKITSGGEAPRRDKKGRWWPMARTLVQSYNTLPQTDARAPYSPRELIRMNAQGRAQVVKAMIKAGMKRVSNQPSREDPNTGAMVSKVLEILKVGDEVRYAVENVRKAGGDRRDRPKQRWSDTVHRVVRVVKRKLGFASYVLSGLPARRFEREDLQGPIV